MTAIHGPWPLLTWDEYTHRWDRFPFPERMYMRTSSRGAVGTPEQFWHRVVRGADEECWPYTGPYQAEGYGTLYLTAGSYHRRQEIAHRFAWYLTNGPIPDGAHALHRCNNRRCCNPAHIYLGTPADNGRDRAESGRVRNGYSKAAHGGREIDPWSAA